MSYVLHVYRMTYKTYGIQDYIFVHPEEWFSMPPFFGSLFVSSFGHNENEPFLGGFAPPATWANHRSVFNGIRFILSKTLCPQRHSKVCFELLETFWVTPKRTCLSVICSSVVGQLRWKEHIKKHKKFLIFLINKLDFIFLRKIRNNDRTIEYIIQAADIHFG